MSRIYQIIRRLFFVLGLLAGSLSQQAAAQTYCTPSYSSGCAINGGYPTGHWISNVSLGAFNHAPPNGTCASVSNYTSLTAMVTAGTSPAMTLTTGGYCGVAVYVDFNQDGDFNDPGEELAVPAFVGTDPAVYNFTITIPLSTPGGNYRMRVINRGANSGNPAANPACDAYNWGNFYDYTLNVVQPCPQITSVTGATLCAPGGTAILSATSNEPAAIFKWYSSAAAATPLFTGNPYTPVMSGSGTTTYYVAAENSICATNPRVPVTVTVLPAVPAPLSLTPNTGLCQGDTVLLTAVRNKTHDSMAVGNGTLNNGNAPITGASANSVSEMLYLSGELGFSGYVEQLSFNRTLPNSTNASTFGNVDIYLKVTAATTVATTTSTAGYNLVYSGPWINTAGAGWKALVLDNVFYYPGGAGDNLSVLVVRQAQPLSVPQSPQYQATALSAYRCSYYTGTGWPAATMAQTFNRPNLRLGYYRLLPINWWPVSNLFKDAALTQPLAANDTNSQVYARPPATVTYRAFSLQGNCHSDSLSVTLNVNPYITNTVNVTRCAGQSYIFNGITYTTSQTGLKDTFATAGCDSIVTLNLTVNPYITNTVSVVRCAGQSYTFNGITYTTSQTGLKDTFATAGCDSIVTLNLTINPYITNTVNVVRCVYQPYTFNGITYTTSQTGLKDTFATAGCDSIVTLNLTVNPYITNTVSVTRCAGQSYTFNGITYTTSQTGLKDTFATAGCDSIVTLNLTVNPYITNTVSVTRCAGQSYTFNGITYTTSQTGLKDTFATAGCDSIVTLNLTVNPYITNTVSVTRCAGQSYTFNGITYTTSQTGLKDTFATAGCDSIVTLNLTVNPYITNTVSVTRCAGQSYTFNGITYTTSQTGLKDTFATAGCDSIVTLNLTVNPYITNTANVSRCAGQSYTFNGITYTTSQTGLKDTFATAGCDSIVTLNLTVNPYITNTVSVTRCAGQSYTFNGITYTTSQTGLKDTFATMGCDSIVTLNLTVNPYITNTVSVTRCAGQSYTFNGITYATAQTGLKDTFATMGCDSIVTLNLSFTPYITNTVNVTRCAGQPYTFNGITYTSSQTGLKDTFVTAGCDSIVTLNLTVNPYITHTVNVVRCAGQPYTFNGITYTSSQTGLKDTFATTGCDSIVTLNLTVNPYITNTVHIAKCAGETYTFNGITYATSQTGLKDTFATTGCDSIVTLNLYISAPPAIQHADTQSCGPFVYKGVTYTTGTTIKDTIRNGMGCDSIILLLHARVYPGTAALLVVDTAGCGMVRYEGINYYSNTTLEHMFRNSYGCDSVKRTVNIQVDNFKLELAVDPEDPYRGEMVHFTASSDDASFTVYGWEPQAWFPAQDAREQHILAGEDGRVWVKARNRHGCLDSVAFDLNVKPLDHGIFMPNAFSPNGDGLNDLFTPRFYMKRAYVVTTFRIYNRNGEMVFSAPMSTQPAWDGSMNHGGVMADMGTYHYYMEVKFLDGTKVPLKGDITLIR
ncbi:GEVED domain-containing protein [Taibaiella chishuiensis]|uniref:Gliding motility-associated-like protein n=1 Tax=Taibaiella chishuiensis TaxID=1434707 RepID=A0A2P8DAE5_9BACT|nr:GEVED domain-containing protein [Taibaiella chishuiensis]PSK94141.1 gliding motility-associated-like protein [Taibaiella chishuiensis]